MGSTATAAARAWRNAGWTAHTLAAFQLARTPGDRPEWPSPLPVRCSNVCAVVRQMPVSEGLGPPMCAPISGPWPVRVRITVPAVATTASQNTQVTTVPSGCSRLRGVRVATDMGAALLIDYRYYR